jgi:hypothetical protein
MKPHTQPRNSQRGVAMFICLFALLLLTAIGMALMYTGDTETSINSNFRSAQAAYYAAKAGLEEGRERLRYGNTYSIPWAGAPANLLASGAVPSLPNSGNGLGVVYILNPLPGELVQPWLLGSKYFDDQLCHENYAGLGLGAVPLGVPCTQQVGGAYYTLAPTGWPNSSLDPNYGTGAAMPYKWVRITLKQVGSTSPYCVDGAVKCASAADDAKFNSLVCAATANNSPYEVINPNGNALPCEATQNLKSIYLVTALAITNTGARRMVQYEVAAISLPPFPSALTMDGNGPFLVPAVSNAFTLSGNNKDSCGPPAPNMPGIGAVSDPAKTQIYNDIMNPPGGAPRPGNYTGSSGTTPDVQNVNALSPPMDPQFQYCTGLQTLYNNMVSSADQVFGSNPPNVQLGTQASPLITVVNGDFTLDTTNANGAGVLVVTGNLTFKGNPPFYGIILVIGNGTVATSSGGGNGNLYGAMLVANCFNNAPNWGGNMSVCDNNGLNPGGAGNTKPCLPGNPSFDWSKGGGTYNIQYDSCWVNNLGNRAVFKVISSREEMY